MIKNVYRPLVAHISQYVLLLGVSDPGGQCLLRGGGCAPGAVCSGGYLLLGCLLTGAGVSAPGGLLGGSAPKGAMYPSMH